MSLHIRRPSPLLLLGGLIFFACPPAAAGSIDLQWDPLPEAWGYRVYHGTEPGEYTRVLDVGRNVSVTVTIRPISSRAYAAT